MQVVVGHECEGEGCSRLDTEECHGDVWLCPDCDGCSGECGTLTNTTCIDCGIHVCEDCATRILDASAMSTERPGWPELLGYQCRHCHERMRRVA